MEAVSQKAVRKDIFKLAIPTVLENMLQMLATVVITAMVGRLATSEIAAQGIGSRLYQIFFSLFKGFSVGAMVIVAIHYGAGKLAQCRRSVEQMYLTCIPLSLLFTIVVWLFPQQMLSFFTKDAALLALAADYLRIAVWAIPFMTVICINTAAFNGHGDTKTPMIIATSLNVVNIIVGYGLIFGFGPLPGWGITGAAVATVASQVFGCGFGLILLYRKKGLLRPHRHGLSFFSVDRQELKELYAAGVPAALENVFWQLAASIMSRVILGYGDNYYAAYQQGLQAEMLCEMPAMGFVTAATTLSARAIGRRDGDMFRRYYRTLLKMATVAAAFAGLLLLVFPNQLMQLLTDKTELQQIGVLYIIIMSFSQIPQIVSRVYYGVIRASGGKRVPMYITFVGIWVVRIPLVILFGSILKLNIIAIWIAIDLDQFVRLAIAMLYSKRKDLKHIVEQKLLQDQAVSPLPKSE